MKEKVSKSQRTGLVMDCTDLVVLVFLLMACGTTLVLAEEHHELNEYCRTVQDCNKIGYFCAKNMTCQCRAGYIPNESRTYCIGFVGSKCTYDKHCIEGAYCTGLDKYEKCRCKEDENYYISEDGDTCINAALPSFQPKFFMMLTLVCISLYLNT